MTERDGSPNRQSPNLQSSVQPYLSLDALEKAFGSLRVTADLSLQISKSEIVALLGPSGSGKTTVLRLVAGFERPDSGRVVVEGEDVTAMPPERRRFGMVFQHYALFPHMTVGENVAFGLEAQGVRAAEKALRVAETLGVVDLAGFENRPVTQLSGGQQQRVALARALAPRPRVLLLDEPLSNLDPTLRERTRRELARVIRSVGITTLFVTHEQEEAFDLADRVAVIQRGAIEQVGSPEELYENPATRFVASFIGRSSALPATWEARAPGAAVLPTGQIWPAVPGEPLSDGAQVDLLVRPESLAFAEEGAPASVPGTVVARRYEGRASLFTVALDGLTEVELLAEPDSALLKERVAVVPSGVGPAPRAYRSERK